MGTPAKKKKKNQSPEAQFQAKLNLLTKSNDLIGAVALFDSAAVKLSLHHFNAVLHICASSVSSGDPSLRSAALHNGLRIFDLMPSAAVSPNEASVTAAARLAAAASDPDRAFSLALSLPEPRLRTFAPALFAFAESSRADKAYDVERHMASAGVFPEEPEISALFKVSSDCGRGEKVYEYLHRLRTVVRTVAPSTAEAIEAWFKKFSESGCVGGELSGCVGFEEVREAVVRNGGGWHGRGWIGEGGWVVARGGVDMSSARCRQCGCELAAVDISDHETDGFARSLASLATERETKSNFTDFQDWVDEHGDFEAIVDGANVGLYQQNFADGGFSVTQLEAVVNELYERSGKKKWPLVVMHNRRSRALLENPSTRKLVDEWLEKGILYTTPSGSNDDWYWLYATVKLKCLLVTNDEMRDHIFELLGSSFFLKWKERHQVRYTFPKGKLQLQMPPPYSSVIQESENGSWHVPIASNESTDESERTWLCITRKHEDRTVTNACPNGKQVKYGTAHCDSLENSSEILNEKTKMPLTGNKRKERSVDISLPSN